MALYHKWDVKNDFAYALQLFSLISDSLDSVQTLVGRLHFSVTATVCHNAISEYLRIDQIQCIIMIYTFDLHWHRFQGQKLLFSAKFAYCQQKACRSCSNIALTHTPLRQPPVSETEQQGEGQ